MNPIDFATTLTERRVITLPIGTCGFCG